HTRFPPERSTLSLHDALPICEHLSAGAGSALTLISAPAGFGKTTLLTEWLAAVSRDGPPVGWLSLDEADNDPSLFWKYVVAALRDRKSTRLNSSHVAISYAVF